MHETHRSRRDFWQNIIITLLSLSAVVLFARTQLYDRDLPHFLQPLQEHASVSADLPASQEPVLISPVRVAVSGSYGRYGSVTLTTSTTAEEFSPLGTLLGEALSSARTSSVCREQDFFHALSSPSVYYDFLHPLPLSLLGGLVGVQMDEDLPARHLVITSPDNSRVLLYLLDSTGQYLCFPTALLPGDLESIIGGFEQGNAMFAYDAHSRYAEDAQALYPLSLFLPEAPPALPELSADSSISSADQILSSLAFNPHTNYRWTEANGTEVITDGDRMLRIYTDGTLRYQGGGSDTLSIKSKNSLPSLWEAATGVSSLLSGLLPPSTDAQLYLREISRSSRETRLIFDYQYSGVPIRFSSGESAAEVILSDASVSSLRFTFRRYTASDAFAALLPLRQAMAIAAETPDAELMIGYADHGGQQILPRWITE